jgi:hypothetical protein
MSIVFDVDSDKVTRATHVESGLSVVYLRWESGRDGLVYYNAEYNGKTMQFSAMPMGRLPHMEKLLPQYHAMLFDERYPIEVKLDEEGKIVTTFSSENVDPKIYEILNEDNKMKTIFLETWHALVSRQYKNEKKIRVILNSNSFYVDPDGEFGAEYEVFPI